ncbi:hypothetical protein CX676_08160 [Paracoccus zhejiangensis]|uniref:Uncharacterized protein n=1 Tax=Paracoccus zhejiangensis TaxID=1077935 RepID=A0A2H5EXV3_9RHOB|nr:hypothetical protein CX676_08160 [Paracoccus zhejiangensis]
MSTFNKLNTFNPDMDKNWICPCFKQLETSTIRKQPPSHTLIELRPVGQIVIETVDQSCAG